MGTWLTTEQQGGLHSLTTERQRALRERNRGRVQIVTSDAGMRPAMGQRCLDVQGRRGCRISEARVQSVSREWRPQIGVRKAWKWAEAVARRVCEWVVELGVQTQEPERHHIGAVPNRHAKGVRQRTCIDLVPNVLKLKHFEGVSLRGAGSRTVRCSRAGPSRGPGPSPSVLPNLPPSSRRGRLHPTERQQTRQTTTTCQH